MALIHLRVSDRASFAVEFSAHDDRSFRLALRKAMFEYRTHFLPPPGRPMTYDRPMPEPHLQIESPETGEWLSAAIEGQYGKHARGLPTDIVELTYRAHEYWDRVLHVLHGAAMRNRVSIDPARKLLPAAPPRKRHLRIVTESREE